MSANDRRRPPGRAPGPDRARRGRVVRRRLVAAHDARRGPALVRGRRVRRVAADVLRRAGERPRLRARALGIVERRGARASAGRRGRARRRSRAARARRGAAAPVRRRARGRGGATPPTSGSSRSSRPTRRGSCACSCSRAPQPAVDVRAGVPRWPSRARRARATHDRRARPAAATPSACPAYLNNLYRLGLVWFSRETLDDPRRYQVLEAQPDVVGRDAQGRARRAHGAPQHPAHAVRAGLLRGVPSGRGGRRRAASSA